MSLIIEQPLPHPTQEIFRRHKISNWKLGKLFGKSEASMSKYLAGIQGTPEHIDLGLRMLAQALEAEPQAPQTEGAEAV